MYDITRFSLADMTRCGTALRRMGDGASTMEGVAGKVVEHLYQQMTDPGTGEKSFCLIRLFKTHDYVGLNGDLKEFVKKVLGREPSSPATKCLTLLATAGRKPEWNDRTMSRGHQAIPLASADFVGQIPMIAQLISQFGIEMGSVLRPDPSVILDLERRTYNTFYIADAVGSPYIPAQDDFVVPFGVKSVLGFGGVLSNGELFVVIMFSKVPIPRETAENVRDLGPSVKGAVEPFVAGAVFA
ncbi:MAG: hypothetical protein IH870_01685 [Chloroflexi bacterium]|nr:hypothetical protein [Chloroflexota bacterium]